MATTPRLGAGPAAIGRLIVVAVALASTLAPAKRAVRIDVVRELR